MTLPIHLIHHPRAGCWAISWSVQNVTFLATGLQSHARAIAAANDICASLGMVPSFVK